MMRIILKKMTKIKSNRHNPVIHPHQRVGVFIDVQNLYYSAKNLYRKKVNFGNILNETGGWHEIPTLSSRPNTSPNALPKETVLAVIRKRQGRRRCGQVVHQELLRDKIQVSLSSVQRTLDRCGLLKKRSLWKRPHDYTPRPEAEYAGALLQMDTVHIMAPDGSRIYIYTLIDPYSRWAYAEEVKKIDR